MLKKGAKRRDNSKPKGRPLDLTALYDVETLLGDEARTPDLLIEHLHKLQDKFGCLHARHLRALADAMRLSQAEVFEVASFYHHFDIIPEDDTAPAPLTVRVCDSLSCALAGGEELAERLDALCDSQNVRVQRVPCIGRCQHAPAVQVGKRAVDGADEGKVISTIAAGDISPEVPAYTDLAAYIADGGYALLKAVKADEHTVDSLIETMSDAGLRGLGGAGFPVGRKWSIVRDQPSPRLMTVNADEGEPGTFKDRAYLESDPHRMLEGALIAATVVGAQRIYIYLRDEYPAAHEILTREIAALDAAGLTSDIGIDLRRGAGAYICGEESAMIESIEGKRGLPRNRPPYIAQVGLFGRPTLNHNVETLFWIRDIVQKGADWFASQGRRGHKGLRSFSVSGRVKNPGVKLAPAGITVRELIDEYCDGMADGHAFKGYLPGGASGGILPASLGDIPLDFGTLEKHGSFVGSHAVVILSDKDDMHAAALNLMRFFKHESCGQCTPCRSGTEKMVDLLASGNWDKDLILDLEHVMRDASICGLGQAAINPVRTVMTFFAKEGM